MNAGAPIVCDEDRPAYDILLMHMRTKQSKQLTTDPLSEQAPVLAKALR